jgi:hypothetical protein
LLHWERKVWQGGTVVPLVNHAQDARATFNEEEPMSVLDQLASALAYYYEHQSDIDTQIEKDWQEVNELAARQPDSPLRQRLRELKRERSSVL